MLTRREVVPDRSRVRLICGTFGWVDHRLLRDGHLAQMGLAEIGLYFFLVLAANRHGVSWYRKEHLCKVLGISEEDFHHARDRLVEKRLIAFSPFRPGDVNGYCQLLPLDGRSGNVRG